MARLWEYESDGDGLYSHSISLEPVSTDGSEQTSSPSLVTDQPESVPDPKTPAAQDVAANDKKVPKISPAINFTMRPSVFRSSSLNHEAQRPKGVLFMSFL